MTLNQPDFVGQSPTGHLTEFPLGDERIQVAIAVQIAKRCAPTATSAQAMTTHDYQFID
jgi:hypothetical protein